MTNVVALRYRSQGLFIAFPCVWLERLISIVFWLKVALVVAAYVLILTFLVRVPNLRGD
jgi:hypothetical protein